MKNFNVTGLCVPNKHYMVDITEKLKKISKMVEFGEYFTINRSRQYGKTTTLSLLAKFLDNKYFVIRTSFEGLGDSAFENESSFCSSFISLVEIRLIQGNADKSVVDAWQKEKQQTNKLELLSMKITELNSKMIEISRKEIVLMIDEVDKSTNNQLFLHFLGMLRTKYLDREDNLDTTFRSVILAGVYDVKNLKLKLRPDEEKKYNSPWNIAAEFDVDMSFNPTEISTMLISYEKDFNTGMDINAISNAIYDYTSGYPFLASRICKVIDEKLDKNWSLNGVEDAVKLILDEKNTLFDDLIKNLENNEKLFDFIFETLVIGSKVHFNVDNPLINIGSTFGILCKRGNVVAISNKIFELRIYNYMISKRSTEKGELVTYEFRANFLNDNKLDMSLVLTKFQEIMYEEFREKDAKFIEREGRLLFLCFLKPIINGAGFYYVESETRMDTRMDIIVTYGGEQHIVELKIWYGENYEKNAITQLAGYLDSKREKIGYLVSFNFNKNKEYTKDWKIFDDKKIFAIVV